MSGGWPPSLAWFARVVIHNLSALVGTITAEAVEVQPARLLGMRFPGPRGRFALQRFRAVRVERIFGPLRATHLPRWHERVSLLGVASTPDILIARTELGAGIRLGRELANLLGLEYEEETAPA